MLGSFALTLIAAVGLTVEETSGLDAVEVQALATELGRAIEHSTGAPPVAGEGDVTLVMRARRIGWRIRLNVERRSRAAASSQRSAIDLTRDRGSWTAPLRELAAALLPEGRALATRSVPRPAEPARTAPAPAPPKAKPKPEAPAWAAPSLPAAEPRRAPPEPELTVQTAPEARSNVVPWVVIGGSAIAAALGVNYAIQASAALDELAGLEGIPSSRVLEEKQRKVFEGALLSSILLSAAVSGFVTGTVLLISN